MPDNPPPSSKSSAMPPLPSSGMTGRLRSPTTPLPNKKGGAGKIVVMLSSVAKPAPAATQTLPPVPQPATTPAPATTVETGILLPPRPAKEVDTSKRPPAPAPLTSTTFVKLPPKTSVPAWSSLSGQPLSKPSEKSSQANVATTVPLPSKWSEPKKSGPQHIPPIKLNDSSAPDKSEGESIFPDAKQPAPTSSPTQKPEGWKNLEPGELNPPAGSLKSLEVFTGTQATASPEVKEKATPLVAPPLRPPTRVEPAPPMVSAMKPLLPPPMPPAVALAKESPAQPPSALHVAPPLIEEKPVLPQEKLAQPNLPAEPSKILTPAVASETAGVHKAPALIESETPPAKPLMPPKPPAAKVSGGWFKKSTPQKKSTPIVVSSSAPKAQTPKIAEAKPALKPPVLPKRVLASAEEAALVASLPVAAEAVEEIKARETPKSPDKPETTPPQSVAPEPIATKPAAAAVFASFAAKKEPVTEALPAQLPPDAPAPARASAPLPLTRTARAKKRQFAQTIIFWVFLVPLTVFALFAGSLYFGRDTRMEGQVIPPPGMTLSNEVWIVSNFGDLASGIAEDLAAERTPILQEIQERQDHVQRAQADVASREERIRLINQQMQAAKDNVLNVVKQSREATQQIWDGEGAQIDAEYTSRFNDLQKAFSDRAKSLKLNYQPDPAYPSPEVWANAYRLALYEVPAGVDSVKEHQWVADQMKQWRDFLKTLDDRKEQLREKAAQLKLEPAPKIADLNSKIEDLQARSDATEAEEVPLKAELQQAQVDLAQAQAADAGLDDKYYKQLYSLPAEAVIKHIPLATNGRFTWVDDDVFSEGENEHHYWIFARATRADGRQYWALHHVSIGKNQTFEIYLEPNGFLSTKAILRPNLTPEEQDQ
jgi:hypothetical protein